PGVDYSDANVPGSCPGLMDINRTWTATDACGNLDMCLQIITISDLIGPAITCPMDVTLACTDPTDPGATGMATATDNCSLNPVISFADIVTPSGLCPQNYTISRTWTAVDDCSNSNQCMQQITVIDLTPPIITCPADLTVDCAASILPAATGFATATDDCDVNLGVDYSDANVPGNCPGLMDINRTWTATDACGNADECLQIIYQIDDSAPVIICPQDLSLSCAIDIPPANIDSVVATDNCGIPLIIFLADQTINLTCLNRFTLLRVYQATDDCNNSASCTQTITINDVLPPILICPASIVVDCALDVPMPDPSLLTVTDNCGGQSTVLHVDDLISNFVCANQYLIRRNYQAIDECENIATCVQEIEVLDLVGPSITCLPAITVACAGDVPLVDLAQIITSDNCGGIVVVTLTSEIMTGQTCENNFALTQTYQATDECGNVNVCTRIITVLDNIPPVITCPGTVSVACADQVPPENISLVVSSDNCGVASVTLQSEFVSNQTCENRFLLTRIYLAEDDCGNTNTCSQVFDVSDILPPTIVFIEPLLAGLLDGDTLNLQCYGQDPQWKIPTFSTSSIQADDICSGEVSVTYEKTLLREGNCIDDGYINLYRLSWTATDICGNSSSAHLILKLVDTISPTIQGIPDDITINCDALLPQPVVVTAFDECLCACVVVTNQSVPQPGCQNGMIIPITWTAIDQCGNVTIETQNITLVDTIGPAITMVHPDIVGLLSGTVMEVECNEDGFPRFVHEMDIESVFGTSECGGEALIVELDTAIIVSSNCATSGFLEERTFLWTVTDLCGNSSTFSFSVRMIDTIPPKWIGVPDTVCFGSPLLMDIEAIDNCDYPYTQITDKTIANPCGSGTAIRRRYDAFDECGNHSVVSAVILPSILNVPVIKFINQDLLDMLPGNVINTRCNINNGNYTSFGVEDIYVEGVCSDLASTSFAEHVLELRDCTIDSVKAIVALVWTVTDICGNTASRSIVATIVDNEPPSFDHFDAEVSIGCSDFLPVVQAVDNCGSVTITLQDTILETSCIYEYTILRLVTATDECGTYTSREQIIHVGGGTGIIFTGIDSVLCDPVDVPVVTAFDPCAELFVDVVMTVDTLDVLCNDGWVLIRTWTAVDVCGNVSTMTQRVIINDHTVPVITVPSYSVLFPFWTHQDSIVYLWQFELLKKLYDLDKNSVVVLDDCDEYIDVEFSKDVIYSADCTVDGYYERWILTWVATDICGNSTSIQVTIDIVDDISPQFLMFPADITIYCEPLPEVPVLEAVDYSPVSIVFTESIEPGLEFGVTIVTRIWTATDVCGNSIQQIQTITWIPDNLLECEIILPEVVECNTHGIFIHSAITGGGGVASYDWKIVGEKCFIQGGQGTPWLKIYVGWAPVKIILTVTDSAGCVSMCMTTMSCILAQTVDGENLDPLIDPATAAHQKLLDKHPLDDGEISEMNMWPNPASGSVNLAFMSTGEVQYTVNISNMFGQTVSGAVMTSLDGLNTKRIDLSQLIDGNYRIQIVTQHRIYTENLIVLSK
ncbi:MAG: T9SS type A sorting domain-containing protein, partial [Saprospiraceae bacterium]|nr:T9SS type A sorting domain-containing protein [Saprospiraceae bacterium]